MCCCKPCCNCRHSCGCGCCCGGNGSNNGVTTLPSFPSWPVYEPVAQPEFPVYISMPATMARGTANLYAGTNMEYAEERGCGRG